MSTSETLQRTHVPAADTRRRTLVNVTATRTRALACALALGILGDWLLRAPGPPGLNVALLAAAGCTAVVLLRGMPDLRGWHGALLGAALLFSFALAGRDAEALRALNLLAALCTALLAANAGAWLARAGISEYVRACAVTALALVIGPAPLLPDVAWRGEARRHRHALAVLRGALIAVPVLFVFGSLLAASDPVFEHLVASAFAFDPSELAGHAALIAVLSWASAGYLGRWVAATPAAPVPLRLPRPQVGAVEGSVALWLLNTLFLLFVLVQLRYLFGGADLVAVTPGLSYAEYARRGFFELVAVAALVVPLLLLADWSVRRERAIEQWVFRGMAYAQIVLLFAILASALYRMYLYYATYGLTEQRLYTTWFMAWIAFVLAWLAATVLQGRGHRFAVGAFASGLVVLLALNVLNAHATIGRVNVARSTAGAPFDAAYAAALSGDAVPELLAALDALPAEARCALADRLLEKWQPERLGGWRTFNYGDWRARVAVREARGRLEGVECATPSSGASEVAAPGA